MFWEPLEKILVKNFKARLHERPSCNESVTN